MKTSVIENRDYTEILLQGIKRLDELKKEVKAAVENDDVFKMYELLKYLNSEYFKHDKITKAKELILKLMNEDTDVIMKYSKLVTEFLTLEIEVIDEFTRMYKHLKMLEGQKEKT